MTDTTAEHGSHFVAARHMDCWHCRWDLAHEYHSGGAKHNPLCPRCNPEVPKP